MDFSLKLALTRVGYNLQLSFLLTEFVQSKVKDLGTGI